MIYKKRICINNEQTDYIVYSNGTVYSLKTKKFLSTIKIDNPTKKENKYVKVSIYHNGRCYQIKLHRLVGLAFIPNPDNKPEINHKDGNKTNNDMSNLEWVTTSENIIHAFKNGLKRTASGNDSHFTKYDESRIEQVCKLLEEGVMTLSDISKFTGVPFSTIYGIINKSDWVLISKNYNIDNYYRDRESYTHDMYEKCFELLEKDELSLYEISDITKIRYSSLSNILSHKPNPLYDDLYEKYNIDNYSPKHKKYKSISKDMINRINDLYKTGMKCKYIKRIVSKEYNINEEAIRVYIRDHIK